MHLVHAAGIYWRGGMHRIEIHNDHVNDYDLEVNDNDNEFRPDYQMIENRDDVTENDDNDVQL